MFCLDLKEQSVILTTSFYDINKIEIIKKWLFPTFLLPWFKFYVYKLWMIYSFFLYVHWQCSIGYAVLTRLYAKNGRHFIKKLFLLKSFGEMCFLEESYKQMQKVQISKFLRAPSLWNMGVLGYTFKRRLRHECTNHKNGLCGFHTQDRAYLFDEMV